MASAPGFATTPNTDGGLVPATLDTSLTAPSNTTLVWTAGASGGMVYEIRCVGVLTTVAAVVNIFRVRGGTYFLFDQIPIVAVTSSTTAVAFKDVRSYSNAIFESGDTIRATVTVAGDQSGVQVTVLGGDF